MENLSAGKHCIMLRHVLMNMNTHNYQDPMIQLLDL